MWLYRRDGHLSSPRIEIRVVALYPYTVRRGLEDIDLHFENVHTLQLMPTRVLVQEESLCILLLESYLNIILYHISYHIKKSIIRIIKSRRMRWAGQVARMGKKRNANRLLVGKPEGKRPLGRPRRRWWMILGWILERWDGVMWTGLVWLRMGTGGELLRIRY
jgi:hypothetical protein